MAVGTYLGGIATLAVVGGAGGKTFIAFLMLKGQRKQITLHLFVNKRIEVTVASTVTSY